MATKSRYTTTMRLEADLWNGLQTVKTRDGIAVSEQMRRAIQMWLRDKEVLPAPPATASRLKGKRR